MEKHYGESFCIEEAFVNFVFIDIDWSANRMNPNNCNVNMLILGGALADVVRNMNPTVMSLYGVSELSNPLSEEQMEQVASRVESA